MDQRKYGAAIIETLPTPEKAEPDHGNWNAPPKSTYWRDQMIGNSSSSQVTMKGVNKPVNTGRPATMSVSELADKLYTWEHKNALIQDIKGELTLAHITLLMQRIKDLEGTCRPFYPQYCSSCSKKMVATETDDRLFDIRPDQIEKSVKEVEDQGEKREQFIHDEGSEISYYNEQNEDVAWMSEVCKAVWDKTADSSSTSGLGSESFMTSPTSTKSSSVQISLNTAGCATPSDCASEYISQDSFNTSEISENCLRMDDGIECMSISNCNDKEVWTNTLPKKSDGRNEQAEDDVEVFVTTVNRIDGADSDAEESVSAASSLGDSDLGHLSSGSLDETLREIDLTVGCSTTLPSLPSTNSADRTSRLLQSQTTWASGFLESTRLNGAVLAKTSNNTRKLKQKKQQAPMQNLQYVLAPLPVRAQDCNLLPTVVLPNAFIDPMSGSMNQLPSVLYQNPLTPGILYLPVPGILPVQYINTNISQSIQGQHAQQMPNQSLPSSHWRQRSLRHSMLPSNEREGKNELLRLFFNSKGEV